MSEYAHRDAALEAAQEARSAPDLSERAALFAEANYHATMAVYEALSTVESRLDDVNISVLSVEDAVRAAAQ